MWLRRSRRYQRTIYDLQFWRGVVGCSLEAVKVMEGLAFKNRPGKNGQWVPSVKLESASRNMQLKGNQSFAIPLDGNP